MGELLAQVVILLPVLPCLALPVPESMYPSYISDNKSLSSMDDNNSYNTDNNNNNKLLSMYSIDTDV